MQDNNLDQFIMENGSELKNDMQVLSKEETDKKFENSFQILYDNDKPIPGNNVTNKISGLEDINEQTALDSLIIKSALSIIPLPLYFVHIVAYFIALAQEML